MYGYLIPKGTRCRKVFFDGAVNEYEICDNCIVTLSSAVTIQTDFIEAQIGDSLVYMCVSIKDLTVVDITKPKQMHDLLLKEV